jgi:flagellar hook-associated protein 3 FlgL
LQALRAALAEPDAELRGPAFADVLAGLDSAYNRLVAGQASVGAGLARLETETNRIAAAKLDGAEALAAVKGLDLTAAIAELEALKLTQSAAQGSFTRVFDGTLFDRLG